MSSINQRKISPSMCLRPGTDKGFPSVKSVLPRRPQPAAARTSSGRATTSHSLATGTPAKVRFADEPPIEQQTVVQRNVAEQYSSVAPSTDSPSKQDDTESSTSPDNIQATRIPQVLTSSFVLESPKSISATNPFEESISVNDLPALCRDDNPFGDDGSVSSLSTSPSTIAEAESISRIIILDNDASVPTPMETPPADFDLKEQQWYFMKMEEFHHPDVAKQQFREQSGHLWNAAIKILMDHYLHPADLTENEFVALVLSQGNATSEWLKSNARLICSRSVKHKMETHRHLSAIGLPPRRLTDEVIELYNSMADLERLSFHKYIQNIEDQIKCAQSQLHMNDAMREKFEGMSIPEKFNVITQYEVQMNRGLGGEAAKLRATEGELADIEALIALQHCSSTESTASFPSVQPNVSRGDSLLSVTREIRDLFESGTNSAPPKKLVPKMVNIGAKFRLGNAQATFTDAVGNEEMGSMVRDAGIDDTQTDNDVRCSGTDQSAFARLARAKSSILKNISHSLPNLKQRDSILSLRKKFAEVSEAAPECNAEPLSVAKRAVVASPMTIRIKSRSSFSDGLTSPVVDYQHNRPDSGIALSLQSTNRLNNESTNTIESRNAEIETPKESDDNRGPLDNIAGVIDKDKGAEEEKVSQQPAVGKQASGWHIRRRQSKGPLSVAVGHYIALHADANPEDGGAKPKRTIRKRISMMMGKHKENDGPTASLSTRASFRGKLFSRKAIPDWGVAK